MQQVHRPTDIVRTGRSDNANASLAPPPYSSSCRMAIAAVFWVPLSSTPRPDPMSDSQCRRGRRRRSSLVAPVAPTAPRGLISTPLSSPFSGKAEGGGALALSSPGEDGTVFFSALWPGRQISSLHVAAATVVVPRHQFFTILAVEPPPPTSFPPPFSSSLSGLASVPFLSPSPIPPTYYFSSSSFPHFRRGEPRPAGWQDGFQPTSTEPLHIASQPHPLPILLLFSFFPRVGCSSFGRPSSSFPPSPLPLLLLRHSFDWPPSLMREGGQKGEERRQDWVWDGRGYVRGPPYSWVRQRQAGRQRNKARGPFEALQ